MSPERNPNKEQVVFHGYREWADKIHANIREEQSDLWEVVPVTDDESATHLYYGWSEMIPKETYDYHLCLILHPSPLPKYRGGSPIQNQLVNGETESAVTILKVGKELDAGEIYSQTPFSLEGSLDEIFERIIDIGTRDTVKILDKIAKGELEGRVQDEVEATVYKRRKPEQSEIVDFGEHTAEEAHNLIRGLNDPYPNAYVVCADGKKLYLTGSHL